MNQPTALDLEAALWVTRLHNDPLDDALAEDWAQWSVDPQHLAAYDKALVAWQSLCRPQSRLAAGSVSQVGPTESTALGARALWDRHRSTAHVEARADFVARIRNRSRSLKLWRRRSCAGIRLRHYSRPSMPLSLVLGLVGLLATPIARHDDSPILGTGQIVQTSLGHPRFVALQDGSELHLNGNTSVLIRYSSSVRRILLETGEVFAKVHHEDARPFEVVVDRAVVSDLGTQFDVMTHDGATNVAVSEGGIRILQRTADGKEADPMVAMGNSHRSEPVYLKAGDIARIQQLDDGTLVVDEVASDPDEAKSRTSWLDAELRIFPGRRLDEIAGEWGRYRGVPIEIADPVLAGVRIGGVFSVTHIDDTALTQDLRAMGIDAVRVYDGKGHLQLVRLQWAGDRGKTKHR